MGRRIVFSVMRDEAPFVLEWVAFHRVIGFDTLVVMSNDCSDGTDQLLDALASGIPLIHRRHSPSGRSPQGDGARLLAESGFLRPGDWVMWLDPDEFLNIHIGEGRLQDLVGALGACQGIAVPWRVFGDAGLRLHPGRQVSPAFTWAEPRLRPGKRLVKTLVRVGPHLLELCVHAPRLSREFWTRGNRLMAGDGTPMSPGTPAVAQWIAGGELLPDADADAAGYRLAQVNHYRVRSRAAFALKYRRGNGGYWRVSPEQARENYAMSNYDRMNQNFVRDVSILRHEAAVTEEIAALRRIPGVAALQDRIWAAFRAHERSFPTGFGTSAA